MTYANNTPRILIVDDEPAICEFVGEVAEEVGFAPTTVFSGTAFQQAYDLDIAVVVIDLSMPEVDGIELVRFLADSGCVASIIFMSGQDIRVLSSACELARARGLNVTGAISKPAKIEELEKMLLTAGEFVPSPVAAPAPKPTVEELETAINEGQIRAHYQPKINTVSRKLAGVEALVRWEHPNFGLLGPDMFVPLASASGLIDDLTLAVAGIAMQDLKKWDANLINVPSVAINFEASSLRDLNRPERLVELLNKFGIQSHRVVIEITETEAISNLAEALDILTRLRLQGIKLSIDDFGTGYSTVSQLAHLPFSEIKIDRSFIDTLNQTSYSETVVRSMINMGHELGLNVVAEGVETPDQLDLLTSLGCDTVQGYMISRPVTADKIVDFVRQADYPEINAGIDFPRQEQIAV